MRIALYQLQLLPRFGHISPSRFDKAHYGLGYVINGERI